MNDKLRVLRCMAALGISALSLYGFEIKTIGATPGEDRFPAVTVVSPSPDEERIVVAFEYELSETDHDIYIAWSNNSGRDWNLRAGVTSTSDERHPQIATGIADTLHLVFQSADTLGYLYASASSLNWIKTSWAETWSEGCRHPDVAVDPVTNSIWFVMEEAKGASNSDIKACYLDGIGRTYQTLTVVQETKNETWPVVACDMDNVLVLYEYHDGTNIDIRGAVSKTSSPMFSTVQIAQSAQKEYHPRVVSQEAGFEYVYQTDDTLYYGLSANGTTHQITAVAGIGANAAPVISGNGSSTDILWHSDSITLSHIRLTGQDPASCICQNSPAVHRITPGERQLALITAGDSAFCIWSGTQMGSANIFGTWWTLENAFAIDEHLNPDYDPELIVTPNTVTGSCLISFIPSTEGWVKVAVYDKAGREVRTLLDKKILPAYFSLEWDGLDNAGTPLPKGIYFVKLKDGSGTRTAKLVLVK